MRRVLATLLLLPLLLAGCQSHGVSREPTPYTVMSGVAGKFEISGYLKIEHPDVQACLALAEQFLQIYLNQDYLNPTLEEEAGPLMTTSTIGDPLLEGDVWRYAYDEVSVALQSLSLESVTFTSGRGKLSRAVVQAEATVRYSHASRGWLHSRNAELDQDHRAAFQIELNNDEDGWRVHYTIESQADA